ncbi:NADP-dependent malic enzyme [Candidatus Gracilibacteria bacterium 28_42_T64]|nr:NADP-dependent malic enzyme [Candidatus Gracilibacteria bacterium 28_42_T64]
MDYFKESLKLHKQHQGKLETGLKMSLNTKDDLSLAYSPGVAEPCREIAKDSEKAYEYTLKANTVAVISDGSAVLGLGNIGGIAGLPVMEGKCALLKEFGGVNAFPIILDTQDTEEIIQTIKHIAPTFGGINLEDFSAPRCFEIEERLKAELDIPVFHDDQHGTAIVTLAGLINGLKITGKTKEEIKVVVNGVGAAGVAITKLLLLYGVKDIVMVDSRGTIHKERDGLNPTKEMLTDITNTACILDPDSKECIKGGLTEAVKDRDVFIGVSVAGALSQDMVRSMNTDPMIFAMANPTPEIMPDLAKEAGAKIIATGRSDFPNQLNNVLVFPGLFKGALQNRVNKITDDMKITAAKALAAYIKNPTVDEIIPSPLDRGVADEIAKVIK